MKFIPVNKPLLSNEDVDAVTKCVKSGWISSSGKYILQFEKNFKKVVNRKYAVAVSSGTAALDIAIKSLNLKEGDEIIVPNFTIISCINEIIKQKLIPVFIDADINTWNIDLNKIQKKITKKTKAILIVHIYGLPVDMDKVTKLVKKNNLFLIEDAAEQLGQKYFKKPIGSFGDISTFSFFANKHITTGEGGMLVTDNKSLYKKFLSYRNICFDLKKPRFVHDEIGWNYRLTSLQASLGISQLKKLNKFIKIKKNIGKIYHKNFSDIKCFQLPLKKTIYANNIYWVFGIVMKNKSIIAKKMITLLKNEGVECRTFFYPLNKQPVLKKLKIKSKFDKFPVSDFLYKYGFYIPSGLGLKKEEIYFVIRKVLKILKNKNLK